MTAPITQNGKVKEASKLPSWASTPEKAADAIIAAFQQLEEDLKKKNKA